MIAELQLAVTEQGGEELTLPRLLRMVNLSLAEGYAKAIAQLEQLTGKRYDTVHIVGGGSNNALLNQVLEVIRLAKLPPIPLKAVLTASNQEWDTHQLYEELKKEREAIAAKLCSYGVEHVIITLGGHGSAVVKADGIQYIPIVQMPHVADPTAAGDSYVGALAVGLTTGLSLESAMAFASHTAAITVSRMGAMPSLPTLEEMLLLLRDRECRTVPLSCLEALR